MKPSPLLYAISDRNSRRNGEQVDLLAQAARLAAAGTHLFQLREKDLPAGELTTLARALLKALSGSSTKLLINSRADVALAVRAHGVHLRSNPEELTARQVHQLYTQAGLSAPFVTISCHSLEDIARQRTQPLSAIVFGPVFEKTVAGEHVVDGSGLSLLKQACKAAAAIPTLALGGITFANIDACLEAGASGVAGIRLFQ